MKLYIADIEYILCCKIVSINICIYSVSKYRWLTPAAAAAAAAPSILKAVYVYPWEIIPLWFCIGCSVQERDERHGIICKNIGSIKFSNKS